MRTNLPPKPAFHNPAKVKGVAEVPKKRTISASAQRKIAAAQRARWAKAKRGKKAA